MKNRREFLMALTAGSVALAVVITPAIADEFFGFIIKVDAEAKKLTLVKKDASEVEVTTTDSTELASAKGSIPFDYEKVSKALAKYKEAVKGVPVTVVHEKNVASKVTVIQKKKNAN